MASQTSSMADLPETLHDQTDQVLCMISQLFPQLAQLVPDPAQIPQWADVADRLRVLLLDFIDNGGAAGLSADNWLAGLIDWLEQMRLAEPDVLMQLWIKATALWQVVLTDASPLRHDDRFADAQWRKTPLFVLIHQTYLLLEDELTAAAQDKSAKLQAHTQTVLKAADPHNFLFTNPLKIEQVLASHGESLVENLQQGLASLLKTSNPWSAQRQPQHH